MLKDALAAKSNFAPDIRYLPHWHHVNVSTVRTYDIGTAPCQSGKIAFYYLSWSKTKGKIEIDQTSQKCMSAIFFLFESTCRWEHYACMGCFCLSTSIRQSILIDLLPELPTVLEVRGISGISTGRYFSAFQLGNNEVSQEVNSYP